MRRLLSAQLKHLKLSRSSEPAQQTFLRACELLHANGFRPTPTAINIILGRWHLKRLNSINGREMHWLQAWRNLNDLQPIR